MPHRASRSSTSFRVRVQFRPGTVAAMLVARPAAADVLRTGGEDAEIKAGLAFTRALAHSGIAGWEGIGDADGANRGVAPKSHLLRPDVLQAQGRQASVTSDGMDSSDGIRA